MFTVVAPSEIHRTPQNCYQSKAMMSSNFKIKCHNVDTLDIKIIHPNTIGTTTILFQKTRLVIKIRKT